MRAIGRDSVGEPIEVELKSGQPISLLWNGSHFQVASIEDFWRVDTLWWLDIELKGICRHYYRLSVVSRSRRPLCVEIYRQGDEWKLCGLAD